MNPLNFVALILKVILVNLLASLNFANVFKNKKNVKKRKNVTFFYIYASVVQRRFDRPGFAVGSAYQRIGRHRRSKREITDIIKHDMSYAVYLFSVPNRILPVQKIRFCISVSVRVRVSCRSGARPSISRVFKRR